MAAAAGWRIVRGRARYWDGSQWVGGDFDPETVSPQLLAESSGVAAPSVARSYESTTSPSVETQVSSSSPSSAYGGMTVAPAPPGTPPPAPGARPGPPSGRPLTPPPASSPAAGASSPLPRAPLGANKPEIPARQADAGRKVKRLVFFIVGGWILIQVIGGLLGQLN
ncbi:hypothetical protein [Demequina sp. NBRC 110054]|uniref:hypothetical protein n=1 Tax=Demequina sp. NBRC 110054 TaxID=1570343 RepID=UPI0009FF7052|nr:hypothetical protein [Demequina sp. NBRC 110054]